MTKKLTAKQLNEIAWKINARPLKDGTGQILVNEFRWYGTVDGDKCMVMVSPGFIWDGASIPRSFWAIAGSPFTGKYQRAALVHDALYVFKEIFRNKKWEPIDRKFADDLFRQIMIEDGVLENDAKSMWSAVRIGGGHAWKKSSS
jgi:hypothetical protein